jgi:hypothetical protein
MTTVSLSINHGWSVSPASGHMTLLYWLQHPKCDGAMPLSAGALHLSCDPTDTNLDGWGLEIRVVSAVGNHDRYCLHCACSCWKCTHNPVSNGAFSNRSDCWFCRNYRESHSKLSWNSNIHYCLNIVRMFIRPLWLRMGPGVSFWI